VRILLLTLHYYPDKVSNAVVMTDLAGQLAAAGHQVTVVTAFPYHHGHQIEKGFRGRLLQRDRHDSVDIIRTYLYVGGDKRNLARRLLAYATFNAVSTAAAIGTGQHDVILAPSPPLTIGLSAFLIARARRIPYVYNVQDVYPDAAVHLGLIRNRVAIDALRRLERFVYRQAAAVTVISNGFRAHVIRQGVPEHNVVSIPNGVDTDHLRPLSRHTALRERWELGSSFVAMYAGNVGMAQGLDVLIDAAERLRRDRRMRFVVVGDGAARTRLEERAAHLGLNNVLFRPLQEWSETPQVYATSDVQIVALRPGAAAWSVPSKVYSAMAAGRAVAASVDVGSDSWRLVDESRCGIVMPPGKPDLLADGLSQLADEPALCQGFGEQGRRVVVDRYTRQQSARAYERLFHRISSKRPLVDETVEPLAH
jgi:colanic acid biosynthesis glycosyl transferase WcaI